MNPQDIRTLKLLEALEADPGPSQRDLAQQLDVSLGLVNSFLKRLARKGYFKVTNIPRNRVRYILTPKGVIEKTRLTYEYITYSVSFYREARQRFRMLFKALQKKGVRSVILYGVSELAEIAYISMQEFSIRLEAIIDDDQAIDALMGIKVQLPDRMNWRGETPVVLTVLTDKKSAVSVSFLWVSMPSASSRSNKTGFKQTEG